MSYRWTDNELDNSLYEALLLSENPSEQEIRELLKKGANVNAVDKAGNSILMEAITCVFSKNKEESWGEKPLDIKFVQLLIDLGADVNYAVEGQFNCLLQACQTWNKQLVEMLLRGGANPNCYSREECESLLSMVEFDQWYEEHEGTGGARHLARIVALLKQYGAKTTEELTNPENNL